MHALFGVPELLSMIFASLLEVPRVAHYHQRDLVQVALVNKIWSEVALDLLWRDVTDVRQLARVLAPLKKVTGKKKVQYVCVCTSSLSRIPLTEN
jgi:hypothetical protein